MELRRHHCMKTKRSCRDDYAESPRQVMNAFRAQTCDELVRAFGRAGYDRDVGAIVLTGAGERAFCTGGDQSDHDGQYRGDRGVIGMPIDEVHSVVRDVPKPVVAKVRGYAIGGGNVLATICDLTLAAETFPGNRPALVTQGAGGGLTLPATKAAIYGTRLIFEPRYKNLGWWQRPDDRAVWTVETAKPGRYRVRFDFACSQSDAGNSFTLTAGTERLTGKIPSTGTWDDYVEKDFGEIRLSGGVEEVILGTVGDPRGALIDLRTVRLVPVGERKAP